jgi:DNA-binding CsgD family transcriptional regulator
MSVQPERILMLRKELLIILLVSFCSVFSKATNIKGRIEIDESWEPIIYLSLINSFDDLNTASYDFLIYEAEIDSLGFFEIRDLKIPKDERIYRLHICKKGDPVSTIIIGGKDENFVHFIMKNNDSINLRINADFPAFQNSIIKGHSANQSLRELFKLRKNLHSPPKLPSVQNRQFIRDQVLEDYYTMADTSSHTIIQLITMYFVNESFASSDQIDLMEKIHAKTLASDTSSPYYEAFLNELTYIKYQTNTSSKNKFYWLLLIVVSLILIGMLVLRQFSKKKQPPGFKNDYSELISQLSVQEKRVLDLLKESKSNKEISQELHIEVSTVKSHLNKIYSRLGVTNRKEIINSEW